MLFGGHVTYNAWVEARSSFVHGNYVATVLLCQSLLENLLSAFLQGGLLNELPPRIQFDETLKWCREAGILTDEDVTKLKALVALRNGIVLIGFRRVHAFWNYRQRFRLAVDSSRGD